jgi:hypothetical protein
MKFNNSVTAVMDTRRQSSRWLTRGRISSQMQGWKYYLHTFLVGFGSLDGIVIVVKPTHNVCMNMTHSAATTKLPFVSRPLL